MKNTEETVKALELVIETAQAEIKRLTQSQEKKVIGRAEIAQIVADREGVWGVVYDNKQRIDVGQLFTTEEKRDAFIAYQQAVANLMYACKPFLTDSVAAYIPMWNGDATTSEDAYKFSKFLWVNSKEKALEIAEAHKEDLKVYLNYKWEL